MSSISNEDNSRLVSEETTQQQFGTIRNFGEEEDYSQSARHFLVEQVHKHDLSIDEQGKIIEKINKDLERTNTFLIGVVLFLLITIIGRGYEGYIRLNSIQGEYVQKTEELDSSIKIFQEKILSLEKENSDVDNKISKEVELQIMRINSKSSK